MEPSFIELKVVSCKDLSAFNFFQKLTIYVLVSLVSDDPNRALNEKQTQPQRTQTDRNEDRDGSNPEWNQHMRFDLGWVSFGDCDNLSLHFEFRHDGLILGDKLIGEVRVPLRDLIQESAICGGVDRFVSYEVRSSEGKPNGVFNFSYRVNGNARTNGVEATYSSQILEGRISGYPVLASAAVQNHNSPNPNPNPNQSHIQYPTLEIQSYPYPPVKLTFDPPIQEGYHYHPTPLHSSPSSAEYHHYYGPPPLSTFPPPPPPLLPAASQFCHPPPPPPPQYPPYPGENARQYYPPFGPRLDPWAYDPHSYGGGD